MTCCPIEHPGRYIHAAFSLFLAQATSKDLLRAVLNNFMDVHHPTEPGMPLIEHRCSFDHMGFVVFTCIMKCGRTRASGAMARLRFRHSGMPCRWQLKSCCLTKQPRWGSRDNWPCGNGSRVSDRLGTEPAAAPVAVKGGVSRREARTLDGVPVRRLSDALLKTDNRANLTHCQIKY